MKIKVTRFGIDELQAAAEVIRKFGLRSTQSRLRSLLACNRNFFIVAAAGRASAGFTYGYELLRPDDASMLFLYSIDVLPQYRRAGVATAIMSYLRKEVRRRHMKELFVFTRRSNRPAVELYKATGGIIENGDDLLFVYPGELSRALAQPSARNGRR